MLKAYLICDAIPIHSGYFLTIAGTGDVVINKGAHSSLRFCFRKETQRKSITLHSDNRYEYKIAITLN